MDNHNYRTFLIPKNLITSEQWDIQFFMQTGLQYIKCVMGNNPTSEEIAEIRHDINLFKNTEKLVPEYQKWTKRAIDAQIKTLENMILHNIKEYPVIRIYDDGKIKYKKYTSI